MELKRSKVYRMKNKKYEDLTYKEKEFRHELLKQARFGRDEKIILSFSLILLFIVSLFIENQTGKTVADVFIFIIGMLGIFLW